VIFAIDPGTHRSAWVDYAGAPVRSFGLWDNEVLLKHLRGRVQEPGSTVLIEKIESYGMAVGEEVFTTVMWVGRFIEALHPTPVILVPRRHVKVTLCGSARAKDPNIRAALIDRFGPGKEKAIGLKASPGPLFGVTADVWSALAVAVAWSEAPL
jgi:hypothetical protein